MSPKANLAKCRVAAREVWQAIIWRRRKVQGCYGSAQKCRFRSCLELSAFARGLPLGFHAHHLFAARPNKTLHKNRVTPKVHAWKPRGQIPEAASGSIWSVEGDRASKRLTRPPPTHHRNGFRASRSRNGRGLNAASARSWILRGHGEIADVESTRLRTVCGLHVSAAIARSRNVRGHG